MELLCDRKYGLRSYGSTGVEAATGTGAVGLPHGLSKLQRGHAALV
jgi:hypothetical protein